MDSILVQFPLPDHIDEKAILDTLDPQKDGDGLSVENLGLLYTGHKRVAPCTPEGIVELLKNYKISLEKKKVVVVGRSRLVGLPVSYLLLQENATVSICHSKTPDVSNYTKEADVVVVAAGRAQLFGKEDFKKGAVVIDVGIHRKKNLSNENKVELCGDVRFGELEGWVSAATPVPGGVGPMTITMLLQNTLILAQKRFKGS